VVSTPSAAVTTGRSAVRSSLTLRLDVLVLDIQMPNLDGVSAAREIIRVVPAVAVLMLTMFDDEESVFVAIRSGARGSVLKDAAQEEIFRALYAVPTGAAIFRPGIARRALYPDMSPCRDGCSRRLPTDG
jgi:DNA-binding NarL/FixJ family response regulator